MSIFAACWQTPVSLLLRLEAGGGYTAGLDSGLTLPVADLAAPLVRMVQYDYGRLRQDAATFRLGLRADYALRRRMSLFLAADYGGGLYGDNTAAHHARLPAALRSETDNIHLNNFLNL